VQAGPSGQQRGMEPIALRALMLQLEWGADEALAESPVSRLAPAAPAMPAAPPNGSSRREPVAPAPPAIGAIDSLQALRSAIAAFEGCALRDTATGPVLPEGEAGSPLLVIYGPPSDADDRACRPMSGPAGAFFDAMLASIGFDRSAALIAPLLPWRPPGGRPPSPAELGLCLPFLHRLIALARPRLLLLLGTQAARAVLGPERRPRGKIIQAAVSGLDDPIACIALAGPDELLRSPDQRPAAWAALRTSLRHLEGATQYRD